MPITTRLDRRKACTRRALLDAAQAFIVERGTTDVSIQEITERADVGFGSFLRSLHLLQVRAVRGGRG